MSRKQVKKISGLIIKADGEVRPCVFRSLEGMRKAVGGDIHMIALGVCDLYCNEDGYYEKLPSNRKAANFANEQLAMSGRVVFAFGGYIQGDVLLTGATDRSGNATSIPDEIATLLATSAAIEILD